MTGHNLLEVGWSFEAGDTGHLPTMAQTEQGRDKLADIQPEYQGCSWAGSRTP